MALQATAPNFSLQQTMLRVKDPKPTLEFYTSLFGMTLVDKKSFPEYKFDLYFLASLPNGMKVSEPGSTEANDFLWTFDRSVLEITHNYGTETDAAFPGYHSGNSDPRGFGHVGFIVDDVEAFCASLEGKVRWQKRLTDGRMKNIAFALDPDGYWVEILPRTASSSHSGLPPQPSAWPIIAGKPSWQQTMYRIRDPAASLPFYTKHFNMHLMCERHFPEARFSLYFLASLPPGSPAPPEPSSPAAWDYMCASSAMFIELTHNHGTETDPEFKGYHNGNSDPGRGYGHIGFLCDRLEDTCAVLEADGVAFTKRPHEGKMRGLAFAKDPDGYLIEIIQRGLKL